ncbi:Transcriptional regulator slyA, putative, partial [Ricinus communis]
FSTRSNTPEFQPARLQIASVPTNGARLLEIYLLEIVSRLKISGLSIRVQVLAMRKPIDSDRSIGALLGELARLLSRNFNARMRHHGLTQTQWQALATLSRREGMRQAELAELLTVQPISLARLVDRLENSGWVERRPDPTDRRAVQLYLTAKAEPILDEMEAAGAATREAAVADFSDTEREQLLKLLNRMKTNLRKDMADAPVDAASPAKEGQA